MRRLLQLIRIGGQVVDPLFYSTASGAPLQEEQYYQDRDRDSNGPK